MLALGYLARYIDWSLVVERIRLFLLSEILNDVLCRALWEVTINVQIKR